jgi:hypothetical protein
VPQVPNPIPEAFGGDVAKAIQGAGQQTEKLGADVAGHLMRMKYWDAEEKGYQALEGFRTSHADMLNSSEVADMQIGDRTVSMPKGYMARSMEQSSKNDPANYLQQANALKDQYLAGINHPHIQEIMARRMDQEIGSGYKNLVKYVGSQDRLTYVKSIASDTYNLQQSAAGVTDLEQLKLITDQIADNNKKIDDRMGFPESMSQENLNKALIPAILNAGKGVLNSGGTLSQANDLIDGQKDISDEAKTDIKDKVESYQLTNAANIRRSATLKQIDNTYNVLEQLDKIPDKDMPSFIQNIAVNNSKLGEALTTATDPKRVYRPQNKQEKAFASVAQGIFAQRDQKKTSDFLVNKLHENGGRLSRGELIILAQTARKYGSGLPVDKENPHPDDPAMQDPAQDKISAGFTSLKGWADTAGIDGNDAAYQYLDQTNKGVDPKVAHDEAQRNAIIKAYPQAITMDGPPNMIHDGSKVRVIFPQETNVYPTRIWDEEKKAFVPNTKGYGTNVHTNPDEGPWANRRAKVSKDIGAAQKE